jgi:hypothetical protein
VNRESRSSFHTTSHVGLAELIEESVEFGPIPATTGGLFAMNPLTSGRLQRRHLRGGFLVVG